MNDNNKLLIYKHYIIHTFLAILSNETGWTCATIRTNTFSTV